MKALPTLDLNNVPVPVFSEVDESLEARDDFDDFLQYDFLRYDSGFDMDFNQQFGIWPLMVLVAEFEDLSHMKMSYALNEHFFPFTKFYRIVSDPGKIFIHRQIFLSYGNEPIKEDFFVKDFNYLEFYDLNLEYTDSGKNYDVRRRKYKIRKLLNRL